MVPVFLINVAVQALGNVVNYAMSNPQQVAELFGRMVSWVPGTGGGFKEQLADLVGHAEDQDKAIAFVLRECESLHKQTLELRETARTQHIALAGVSLAAAVALVIAVLH